MCGHTYIFVFFYFQRGNKAHQNIPSTVEPSVVENIEQPPSILLETLELPPISELLRTKVANPLQQQPPSSSAHILQQKVGQSFDTNYNFELTAPTSVAPIMAPMNYNITQDPAMNCSVTNTSQDIVISQQLLNQLLTANNGQIVQLSEEEMSTQILQSNCKCEQIVPVLTDLTATFKVWSDRQLIFENEVRHFMATATGQIRTGEEGAPMVSLAKKRHSNSSWSFKKLESVADAAQFESNLEHSDYAQGLVSISNKNKINIYVHILQKYILCYLFFSQIADSAELRGKFSAKKGVELAYHLVDEIFTRSFFTLVSWTGEKKKDHEAKCAFKPFVRKKSAGKRRPHTRPSLQKQQIIKKQPTDEAEEELLDDEEDIENKTALTINNQAESALSEELSEELSDVKVKTMNE